MQAPRVVGAIKRWAIWSCLIVLGQDHTGLVAYYTVAAPRLVRDSEIEITARG